MNYCILSFPYDHFDFAFCSFSFSVSISIELFPLVVGCLLSVVIQFAGHLLSFIFSSSSLVSSSASGSKGTTKCSPVKSNGCEIEPTKTIKLYALLALRVMSNALSVWPSRLPFFFRDPQSSSNWINNFFYFFSLARRCVRLILFVLTKLQSSVQWINQTFPIPFRIVAKSFSFLLREFLNGKNLCRPFFFSSLSMRSNSWPP